MEYFREGQGSLLQCVLTPADPYMPLPNQEIADRVHQQVSLTLCYQWHLCTWCPNMQGNVHLACGITEPKMSMHGGKGQCHNVSTKQSRSFDT